MKFIFSLQHPLTCKPWTTLSNPCNKERGKYICKEVFLRFPSCFFLPASLSCVLHSCVILHASVFDIVVVGMLNERVNNYITIALIPLGKVFNSIQTEFKPVKLRLKIDLVSYPAWAEGLVNMIENQKLSRVRTLLPARVYGFIPISTKAKRFSPGYIPYTS